ncbi:MAG: glycogen synthase [Candidatus Aminicenantes bacterium]|nr:glycogen synthase [Candidatus Aminicenantes bacterium]
MKVLYIAAECKPFSKVGGVGDVAGELPIALQKQGVDIEIVIPLYREKNDNRNVSFKPLKKYRVPFHGKDETIQFYKSDPNDFPVPVNFVSNATYFEGKYGTPYIFSEKIPFFDDILRFSFFSEACLQLIKDKQPDIVHVNDWVLGYLFGRMAMEKLPQRRVLTIHNIGYQGNIGIETIKGWHIEKILADKRVGPLFLDPRKEWHSVNALRLALELAHRINTVSPNYCQEITEPENSDRYFEGGKGLDEITRRLHEEGKLIGILNGFEYKFRPEDKEFNRILGTKAKMKQALSKDFTKPDAFLLGFVGRAVEQKFKLLTEKIDGKSVLEHILEIPTINIAILATGSPEYEAFLKILKEKERDNCSITIAFDREKANQISLGSDVFLMPSLFEPCGITQMESLSNATPPLVRWTGGLVDTVRPHIDAEGTGFGFDGSTKSEVLRNLISTIKEALNFYTNRNGEFEQLQKRGFNERFLWSTAAKKYIEKLYKPAMNET